MFRMVLVYTVVHTDYNVLIQTFSRCGERPQAT
jgi:hypothetical protein